MIKLKDILKEDRGYKYDKVEFKGGNDFKSIKDIQSKLKTRFENYLFKGYSIEDGKYGTRIRRGFINNLYPVRDGRKLVTSFDKLVNDFGWDMYLSLPGSNKVQTLEEMAKIRKSGSDSEKLDFHESLIAAIRNPSKIEFYYTKNDKLKG